MITVGVDIGGTSAKLGAVSQGGEVEARAVVDTGADATVDQVVPAIAEAVDRLAAASDDDIGAVGVGCAGLVDTDRGRILVSPNLPLWRDVDLADRLAAALRRPVVLLNDADAFAYGEAHEGAGAGCRAGLFVTLGTGVGGALVLNGDLYRGAHGLAGEVGHVVVDIDGDPDGCGLPGCLERLVGNARIVERAERFVASGMPGDTIRRVAGGEPWTPKVLADAALAGDETSRAVFAETGRILGVTLAGLNNLLSLDAIVIGGGVSESGELLLEPLRAAFHAHSMVPEASRPSLVPCRFGAEAGLVGAALFARDRHGEPPSEPTSEPMA